MSELMKSGGRRRMPVVKRTLHLHTVRTALAMLVLLAFAGSPLYPCSTFVLKSGRTLLVGHNLDERSDVPGLVIVNKRHAAKTSVSWASLVSGKADQPPLLAWTSRYASLTFSAFGRDFPDDGLNEAGLFIGEMTLAESKFPEDAGKPRIFMCLWMQYILDTCGSVAEAVEAASAVAVDGWGWHFLAADQSGAAAVIEFLDGKVVVHSGEALPVPVLCNERYERDLEDLPAVRENIAASPELLEGKDIPRFAQAAVMLERHSLFGKPAVEYAFDILDRLDRGGTQWSLVCDLRNLKVWFRSARSAGIKSVRLGDFNPGCEDAAKFLDLHQGAAGEASGLFGDCSPEAARDFAARALAAILRISPGFERMVASRGGTMEGLLERFAAYPERSRCKE